MNEEIKTEERFDLELLPPGDGVLVLSAEGRVLSANLQVERILERKVDRGQTLGVEDLFAESHLPSARIAFREALQGGHSRSNLTADLHTSNGGRRPVIYSVVPLNDFDNRPIGLVVTLREPDLPLPRRQAEAQVLVPGQGNLFENLAEGAFSIDTRWHITAFNQRAEEITGFDREEVLGRFCWDIFKSDLCRSSCPLKATLDTGVTHFDQDVRMIGKKGHRFTILVNTSIIKDKNNLVLGALETFRPLSVVNTGSVIEEDHQEVEEIIGRSPALTRLLSLLPDVGASEASVILEGESGTGKELVARAIHRYSHRSNGPFVPVSCSALAETLLESELFGHEKAAFTGAINRKAGRFELAKRGTLFLDEIAEIKPELQVKLLRVLEEGIFERVGGIHSIPLDARIIAATNRNLREEVRCGRFREDLYYRLCTVPIGLPSLRERPEDIPLLVNHFVARLNQVYHKNVRGVDPKVLALFRRYPWPGNVRELKHTLEYAFVFVKGPAIGPAHLPELKAPSSPESTPARPAASPLLMEDERQAILTALERAGGRRQEAADLLGLSRSSLWRKMKAHSLR
jgi:PAS domain S-box-containing protein